MGDYKLLELAIVWLTITVFACEELMAKLEDVTQI